MDAATSARAVARLALIVAVGLFVVQNTARTPMSWLMLEFTAPLWALAIVLFIAGVATGWGLRLRRARRDRRG